MMNLKKNANVIKYDENLSSEVKEVIMEILKVDPNQRIEMK